MVGRLCDIIPDAEDLLCIVEARVAVKAAQPAEGGVA